MRLLFWVFECIMMYLLSISMWSVEDVHKKLFVDNVYVILVAVFVLYLILCLPTPKLKDSNDEIDEKSFLYKIKSIVFLLFIVFILGCCFDWFPFEVNYYDGLSSSDKTKIRILSIPFGIMEWIGFKLWK